VTRRRAERESPPPLRVPRGLKVRTGLRVNLICHREVSADVFFDEPQSRAKSRYWFRTTSSLDNFRLVDHSGVGIVNHHKRVCRY
jgi:hypothetical protein